MAETREREWLGQLQCQSLNARVGVADRNSSSVSRNLPTEVRKIGETEFHTLQ
jgi:hypothetical protein